MLCLLLMVGSALASANRGGRGILSSMDSFSTQAQEFVRLVSSAKSVLIGTHLNPDGDALGSALTMSYILDQYGVKNELICNNLAPYNLEFLPGIERVKLTPTTEHHDLGIVLDLDSLNRLGKTLPYFQACEKLVVIDHHVPHEEPGDLRIVDTDAPATALILYRLIRELDVPVTESIATCLMAGIITDTGSFRYRNTTEESLHAAAELLHDRADLARVCDEVYQRKPLNAVKLLGRTLQNMRLDKNDQIAWSTLGAKDFSETGAIEQHTEGLVNELLNINTVKIAALIRQPSSDKLVRASVRSREGFDVAAAVREFGGGGHVNAAGVTFECNLDDAEKSLVGALVRCLDSSQ